MKTILAVTLIGFLIIGCAPAISTPDPYAEPDFVSEGLIPLLSVPEGAELFGGGGGGSDNSLGVASTFSSDLNLEEVHQHYLDQLEAAGWRLISEQDNETGKTSFWELTDKGGRLWSAKLDVIFGDPDLPDAYTVNVMIVLPQ